jgi:hypothetical protein
MSRSLLPSAALAALSLVSNVRPRFMEDRPELADAALAARAPILANRRRAVVCCRNFRCDFVFACRNAC